jgi:hypothetical protein
MAVNITNIGSLSNSETYEVNFTCSPSLTNSSGYYETIYTVASSENSPGYNITASCTVTAAAASIDWNETTISFGSVQKGTTSNRNATVTATQSNTNINITSTGGNGSTFINASPLILGDLNNGETTQVEINCSPENNQTQGTFEATFLVNSTEDGTGDTLTASCTVTAGGGGNGGGGGGVGPGKPKKPKTHKIDIDTENPEELLIIDADDHAIIAVGENSEQLTVEDIYGSQVFLTLSNDPENVISLGILEPLYLDLNADNKHDIILDLERVSGRTARIRVVYLKTGIEHLIETSIGTIQRPDDVIRVGIPSIREKEQIQEPLRAVLSFSGYLVILKNVSRYTLIIAYILLLAAVSYYIAEKKQNKKKIKHFVKEIKKKSQNFSKNFK